MKICIPSHRRAATISTHRLAPDAVPESQAAEYQAAGCPNVRTHPDEIRGLTPKLNWMLDQLADSDGIIFLDDDLEYLCRCFTCRRDKIPRKVTEADLIHQILIGTAALAAEMGAHFFGWESSESTIRYYSGLDPFAFTGFINGCAMGFIAGHGLRFDESIVAKNDYDICALNAFRHRICLKDTRYAFCQRETFTGSGGQSFYRNSETEARALLTETCSVTGPSSGLIGSGLLKVAHYHFFTDGVGPNIQPDAVYEARAREIRRDNRLELEQ